MEVVSLHDEYWDKVVSYTIDSVKRGLTPNPDMMCNKFIKFGCFEEKWGKDFDKIATGHYATTTEIDGKVWLSTAKDPVKDQTDFLGQITRLQIQKLMFPIGHLMKAEVRAIAAEQKLPSAMRKDSQGICFPPVKPITTTLSSVTWANVSEKSSNWKRAKYWASTTAIGSIPSASGKDWA